MSWSESVPSSWTSALPHVYIGLGYESKEKVLLGIGISTIHGLCLKCLDWAMADPDHKEWNGKCNHLKVKELNKIPCKPQTDASLNCIHHTWKTISKHTTKTSLPGKTFSTSSQVMLHWKSIWYIDLKGLYQGKGLLQMHFPCPLTSQNPTPMTIYLRFALLWRSNRRIN
jgi:hypothetical protein